MDHWHIEQEYLRGLGVSEIASKLSFSESAIRASLTGRSGLRQREKARRMDYFIGGAVKGTGNSRKASFTGEDGEQVSYDQELNDWNT